MKSTGLIITLAWPETFCSRAFSWYDPILKRLGIGSNGAFRVGHAALALVERATGNVEYYDFGRYVTPHKHGRVRSAHTDFDLHFPLDATFDNYGNISNIHEILQVLETGRQATHGDGLLIASVCEGIDFEKAENYIHELRDRRHVSYGPFSRKTTNCSRFVADTIHASCANWWTKMRLRFQPTFAPNPIGNVAAAASDKQIWVATPESVMEYGGGKRKAFLDFIKYVLTPAREGEFRNPDTFDHVDSDAQWLDGHHGAWFIVQDAEHLQPHEYLVKKYCEYGIPSLEHIFVLDKGTEFDISSPYEILHGTNCAECLVLQNDQQIVMKRAQQDIDTSYTRFQC